MMRLAVVGAAAVLALGAVGFAVSGWGGSEDPEAIRLVDDTVRRTDDVAAVETVETDDDDTGTGDGDRTRGDDGTGGGDNTGDGDRTRGDDGTGGGDNTRTPFAGAQGGDSGGGDTGGGGSASGDGGSS